MREMLRESRQLLSRDSHSESDVLSSAMPLICSGQDQKDSSSHDVPSKTTYYTCHVYTCVGITKFTKCVCEHTVSFTNYSRR